MSCSDGQPAAGVRRRFPESVYGRGDEPDPRFTLANERTLLAWLRTSLALLAGGVALEAFDLPIQGQFRLAASVSSIVVAMVLPLMAWTAWASTERALRERKPLPAPLAALPLALVLVVVASLMAVGLVLG
ncbi:YidH family protein [Mycolicibacterium goodii]|uniref:Membrane protein n=1 Tax=Mycolicibacterium goodii TaxID=134601 RepID=A0A0K0X230_MYCGD|nr:membrane protein [Mycolicibacterium goodii]